MKVKQQILKQIREGKFKGPNLKKWNSQVTNKKEWYKIGKVVNKGFKIKLCKESRTAAKRTYRFYNIEKGNWEGPMPWRFGKMNQEEFDQWMAKRMWSQFTNLEEVVNLEEEGLTSLGVSSSYEPQNGHMNPGGLRPEEDKDLQPNVTGHEAFVANPPSDPTLDPPSYPTLDPPSDPISDQPSCPPSDSPLDSSHEWEWTNEIISLE